MNSRIFVFYLISFMIGVYFAPLINLQADNILYLIMGLIVLLPLYFRTKVLKHFIVLIIFILAGILGYQNAVPKENQSWTNYFNGEEVEVYGYVNSEPVGEKLKRFYFKPKNICSNNVILTSETRPESDSGQAILDPSSKRAEMTKENCTENPKGNILVTLPRTEELDFGDQIVLTGNLEEPENQGEFNYANYLSVRKVYSEMKFPEVNLLRVGPSRGLDSVEFMSIEIRKVLFFVKATFVRAIENIYPEPNGSLMLGLLLGIKKSMPDDLIEAFNKTGTTHIVALSGFNVTIIVMMLKSFTQNFSRRIRFWLPISFIILFVVMTGADAPIVRAAIMGFMLLLAKQLGRQDDATVAVFFAAFLMIFFNPMIVRYDIGFQLSFACMLGLIYIYPIFEKLFHRLPRLVGENLGITLAAQIAALPIILYYFGTLSVIAPIANLLILPAVPLAMGFGALAAVTYMIFPLIGGMFAWTGYLLTSYIVNIAIFLSEVSFSAYNFRVGAFFVLIYFIIVINIVLIFNHYQRKLI